MLKQFFLPLIVTTTFFAAGCSKDDDTPQQTRTELITQGTWKFESASAMGQDASGFVENCLKDNVITFTVNGTGTVDEATLVCDPTTAGPFNWAFQGNESQINIDANLFAGSSGLFNIVSLNSTNLVLSQEMTISPFPATTVTITLKH